MAEEIDRKVELVRVPRQEQVFEREQIFGRDAASVFPTENKKAAAEAAEALKSKLGANRFISESEIQELQKEYGGTTEGSEPVKPLAHILLEAKQAKDEAFQNQWKQMKQGKNRPLDEDEVDFVDSIESATREREQAQRKQETDALEAYQLAVRAAAEARQLNAESASETQLPKPSQKPIGPKKPPTTAKPAKSKPIFVRKRASADPAVSIDESTTEPASKQIRLSREEHDVVASCLPVPGSNSTLLNLAQHHSLDSSARGEHGASAAALKDGATAEAASVSRGGHDPVSTSLPKPEGSKSLSTFLADYGSESDDDHG